MIAFFVERFLAKEEEERELKLVVVE